MGSEQSQPSNNTQINAAQMRHPTNASRLTRGNTIAVTGQASHTDDGSPSLLPDSSPPISVCSDSDLPYISYTDKPIGDSPKFRNKGNTSTRNVRVNSLESNKRPTVVNKRIISTHNIVVVRAANKEAGTEKDPDIQRLQSIPQFLPVMRGTLSLPANRDPEVLERLQPVHLTNICNRMQSHLNACSSKIASDQAVITAKIKEVDMETAKVLALMVEKQKYYSSCAEQFSKVRQISQQLSRCNTLLNQNIESMDMLNNMLSIDERLEPFVWKTTK
ncbi:BLOC-1-related complex subunit 5 [Bradysia coprophila]|uniref:BLOC-1-related complex subunit 5 n=1 Tax=Bradysia coprophila TaxID=38358 RepID=UPI00187DD232|nr:BLOC-1-related complex subunit 5 [Bradysia coprophila]